MHNTTQLCWECWDNWNAQTCSPSGTGVQAVLHLCNNPEVLWYSPLPSLLSYVHASYAAAAGVDAWHCSQVTCCLLFIVLLVSAIHSHTWLAHAGKSVVHTYTAGNEPYSVWEGLQRGSKDYEDMKQQRAETLWKVSAQLACFLEGQAEWA